MDEWHCWISDYLTWLAAGGKSPDTVRLRRLQLWRAARALPPPGQVTLDDLTAFLAVDHWKPETRRSMRAAVKMFYLWAVKCGRIDRSPADELAAVTLPAGRPRPTPELVLAAALERADARGRLMLMLAAYAGLRRGEIAKVHTRDVVEGNLRVTGKGGKTRVVPLHPVLAEAIAARRPGWVFSGKIDGHISPGHVGKVMSRLLQSGWTAHTLRHRFATAAYAIERDLFAVQQLLGHSSASTTARYTALPTDALSRAVMGAGPTIAA